MTSSFEQIKELKTSSKTITNERKNTIVNSDLNTVENNFIKDITAMKDYELKNIDPEDIEDLLIKVETSFDITFVDNELAYI